MNFFKSDNKAKIVEKNTTFTYSKKTPQQIIEERENKKTKILFNKINSNNRNSFFNKTDSNNNKFNGQNKFKGKFR